MGSRLGYYLIVDPLIWPSYYLADGSLGQSFAQVVGSSRYLG